jgi:ribosomal protein S8
MARTYYPAPDKIAWAGAQIAKRILEDNYTLTDHVKKRMTERKITLDEIMECIRRGNIGGPSPKERIEGFMCINFWYGVDGNELIVPVRSRYGDFSAPGIIITAYRNGEDVPPEGMALEGLIEHVVVEKEVIRPPAELTDEQLEAELARRRSERTEHARKEAEMKINELESRQARLIADRKGIDKELADIEAQIEQLRKITSGGGVLVVSKNSGAAAITAGAA